MVCAAGPVDLAASWYWTKRLVWYKEGDIATIGADELRQIRYVSSTSYSKPRWMVPKSRPHSSEGRYSSMDWHAMLPLTQIHPRFHLLHVAFIRENGFGSYGGVDREQGERYLLVREEGERYRVYPRSLITPGYSFQPQRTLRPDSVAKLVDAWDAAFDALPTPARSRAEAIAGVPTIAASLLEEAYDQRMEATHPFWINAKHLLWAAFGFFRVNLPVPTDSYSYSYHWTVYSPRFEEAHPNYRSGPLVVELPWNGWYSLSRDTNIPSPSADVLNRLELARRVVETLLNRFAPFTTPLFFDTLHADSRGGYRFNDESWGKSHPLTGTGQHFPWLHSKTQPSAHSLHSAFHWAQKLPPDWCAALQELVHSSTTS